MEAQDNVWAYDENPPYEIKEYYQDDYSIADNGLSVTGPYDGWKKGWNNLVSNNNHVPPFYSHGLYKFTIQNESKPKIQFYINFRDSDWDGGFYPCGHDTYFY